MRAKKGGYLMPTLMPWTNVEIGDLDVFAPTLPSLVVYTWYVDDEPESTVTHFWRDENTGAVHHELVHVGPFAFDVAVARAQEEAPKRSVERIHVKHARSSGEAKGKPETKRIARTRVVPSKKRTPAKKAATMRAGTRKQPA
jgi:hypothetical protein